METKILEAVARCKAHLGYSILILVESLDEIDQCLEIIIDDVSIVGFYAKNIGENHTEIRLKNGSIIVIELANTSRYRNYSEIIVLNDIINNDSVISIDRPHGYLAKNILLFFIGYCLYIAIEVTYRNVSYPIMGICGGLAIIILDKINDKISWDVDLLLQGLFGSSLISLFEFVIGEIALRTNLLPIMWDYSKVPFNFDGVICLPFSIIWILMSIIAIILADAINYYLLDDEQVPYYKLFGKTIIQFKEK
jgi:hypothetical protein